MKALNTLYAPVIALAIAAAGCSQSNSRANSNDQQPGPDQKPTSLTGTQAPAVHASAAEESSPGSKTVEVALKPYPLDTCLVSGEKLDSMGEHVSMVYEGQEIRFCSKDCIKDFKEHPTEYLTKLAALKATPSGAKPALSGSSFKTETEAQPYVPGTSLNTEVEAKPAAPEPPAETPVKTKPPVSGSSLK